MNFFNILTKNDILKYTYTKSYKAGNIIFNAGEVCNAIGYLEKGEASIITITHTEKEETITYLNTHSIFGDMLIFASSNIYLGHCIAKSECLIRYIKKENLNILLENKSYLNSYLTLISNKAQKIKKENKLLRHTNLTDRLIHYLLEESLKYNSNVVEIKNVSVLANILSVPRPTISRLLTKLKNENIIEIKKTGQMCFIKIKK